MTRTQSTSRITGEVDALVRAVRPPAAARPELVQHHLDVLTKPRGSLGFLEALAIRLALIYGDPPAAWKRRVVFVLAGDHGVAARGVSSYPPEVTAQMCRNYSAGGAAISVVARTVRATVVAADLGVNATIADVPNLVHAKVRHGTRDLSTEAAMTRDETATAILRGASLVEAGGGVPDIIGMGEMGIGNTTSASALTAALTGTNPARLVGRGTGIGAEALRIKRKVVREAVARISQRTDPLGILAELGGFEIAGLVGVLLAGARHGRAVVTDGVIATAAALVAVRLCPPVRQYLFASHCSTEPAHRILLDALELRPLFMLDMRLGEGTGAALAFPILEASAALLREMATFEEAGVSQHTRRGRT